MLIHLDIRGFIQNDFFLGNKVETIVNNV